MSHPSSETSYEKRVAVITLRLLCGLKYAVIGEKLGIQPRTAHSIFARALERTEPALRHSFVDVARNAKDAPRSGRPSKKPAGSDQPKKKKSRQAKDASQNGVLRVPEKAALDIGPVANSGDAPLSTSDQTSLFNGQNKHRAAQVTNETASCSIG